MDKLLFSDVFDYNEKFFDRYFRTEINYDVVGTRFNVGKRKAKLYFIDGFIDGDTSERVMNFMMQANKISAEKESAKEFAQ